MNLLSKIAPIEVSIANMKTALNNAGCHVTFSKEKHPLKNCYSVNLASVEAPKHIYSNGKGIHSEASMASALGEYIERLQTNNFFIDFYLPNRKHYPDEVAFDFDGEYLNDRLNKIYNPNGELEYENLIDYNSDYFDKIVALPFVKYSTKEFVYIPVNILSNLYVSNGLASGNSPIEAQVQALSEIYERYVKIEIIKNAYSLPSYPYEILCTFKKVYDDIISLRQKGYIVEVLDASLGGAYPVTAISLINPMNGTLFVSFGSHPILEVSLERTMTELMQGRNLDDLDSFEIPTFDMSIVSDNFNIESHFIDSNGKLGFGFLSDIKSFDFSPWIYDGDTIQDELSYLTSISKGKDIYMREYDYLGFYSCQMIIPTISEIYPIEDLVYNNKNSGKQIRDIVLNFKDYDPQEILDAIDSLDESIDMENYIGVIFENNFTLSRFKAQIFILLGEMDNALMLLEFHDNRLGTIVSELIRMNEKNLSFDDYKNALYSIFTEELVQKALNILDGNDFLIDTTLHQDYLNMLAMYDRLGVKKL